MPRLAVALLAAVAAVVASLVLGGEMLELALPGGVPLGNALVVVGLVVGASVPIVLSRPGTRLRAAGWVALAAAVAWYPVSIALAGNLDLVFSGDRGRVWLWLTVATALLVLATLGRALAASLRKGPVSR